MYRFVIKPDYQDILISLLRKSKSVLDISKESGKNEGHLRNVIYHWQRQGILSPIKVKNIKRFCLSNYGENVVVALIEIKKAIHNKPDTITPSLKLKRGETNATKK